MKQVHVHDQQKYDAKVRDLNSKDESGIKKRNRISKKDLKHAAAGSQSFNIKFDINDPEYARKKAEYEEFQRYRSTKYMSFDPNEKVATHESGDLPKRREAAAKGEKTKQMNKKRNAERTAFLQKVERIEDSIRNLEAQRKMAKSTTEIRTIEKRLAKKKRQYMKLAKEDAQRLHSYRSWGAIKRDQKSRSKHIANDFRWAMKPGYYDYEGVDTPDAEKNPYVLKRALDEAETKRTKQLTKETKKRQRSNWKRSDEKVKKLEKLREKIEKSEKRLNRMNPTSHKRDWQRYEQTKQKIASLRSQYAKIKSGDTP